MDQGIPAPYQPPEISEKILRGVAEVGLTREELKELADKDKWYQRKLAKLAELQNLPPITKTRVTEAWKEVVKIYWIWINLSTENESRLELIDRTKGQLRRRLIELRRIKTLKKVKQVQRSLGYRFRPEMNSGGPAT
jgi:hypothetical protein